MKNEHLINTTRKFYLFWCLPARTYCIGVPGQLTTWRRSCLMSSPPSRSKLGGVSRLSWAGHVLSEAAIWLCGRELGHNIIDVIVDSQWHRPSSITWGRNLANKSFTAAYPEYQNAVVDPYTVWLKDKYRE